VNNFEAHIEDTVDAINLCFENGSPLQALVILYAAIDGAAWLSLPDGREDVRRGDFKKWVDTYLCPELTAVGYTEITSEDLYAARCAILHTQTAESKASRDSKGSAREIWYGKGGRIGMVNMGTCTPRPAVVLDLSKLFSAFRAAMSRFHSASADDRAVAERLSKLFTIVFYRGRVYRREAS
jgi:hypothetical protein